MSFTVGAYSSRPASPSDGDVYVPNDGYPDHLVGSGGSWLHLYGGQEYNTPKLADFSVVPGSTGSSTENGGGLTLEVAPTKWYALTRPAPAAPYTVRSVMLSGLIDESFSGNGLMLINNTRTKAYFFGTTSVPASIKIVRENVFPPSTVSVAVQLNNAGFMVGRVPSIYVENDGTNLKFWYSSDGFNFTQLFSETIATFLVTPPSLIGFRAFGSNSYAANCTLIDWKVVPSGFIGVSGSGGGLAVAPPSPVSLGIVY